jgi:rod shape-determining protein MreC
MPKLTTGAAELSNPRLEYQSPQNALRQGERIVTSGDGGVFPRGLLVGIAERDREGVWRVKLAAASAPIDYVRLAPFAPVEAPELAPVEDLGPPRPVFQTPSFVAAATTTLTAPTPGAPQKRRPILPPPTPPPPGSAGDDAAPPAPDAGPLPTPPPSGPPQ